MADLSKIKLNGTVYNFKDAEARNRSQIHIVPITTTDNQNISTSEDISCQQIKNWIDNGDIVYLENGNLRYTSLGYDRGLSDLEFIWNHGTGYYLYSPYKQNNQYTNLWRWSSYDNDATVSYIKFTEPYDDVVDWTCSHSFSQIQYFIDNGIPFKAFMEQSDGCLFELNLIDSYETDNNSSHSRIIFSDINVNEYGSSTTRYILESDDTVTIQLKPHSLSLNITYDESNDSYYCNYSYSDITDAIEKHALIYVNSVTPTNISLGSVVSLDVDEFHESKTDGYVDSVSLRKTHITINSSNVVTVQFSSYQIWPVDTTNLPIYDGTVE